MGGSAANCGLRVAYRVPLLGVALPVVLRNTPQSGQPILLRLQFRRKRFCSAPTYLTARPSGLRGYFSHM
jgi:hypothetical protein